MLATVLFYFTAMAFLIAVIIYVLAPMVRGAARGERRASYDMQVYRDQLREVDADLARGVVTEAEAAAMRVEISRRLLASADEETIETEARGAPRRMTVKTALVLAGFLGLGAVVLYAMLGAGALPDLPLESRLAALAEARANRPSQAEMEARVSDAGIQTAEPTAEDLALLGQLRSVLAERAQDVDGHRLLARSEASLGRWPEARAAQDQVVSLLGVRVTADDLADLAEFMIMSANGYVSPESEELLSRALSLAADNPVARYYSGLSLLQGGRPDLTLPLWSRLLAEGPQDAPWIAPIAARIDAVAAAAGQPAPPVPNRSDAPAAEDADQAAMIAGMVSQLSDRLATEGGPPADWARLIRSLGVLGRTEEADAIFREAREVFAADPEALAMLRETAVAAGITP